METKFIDCFLESRCILMEGALAERLKREFNINIREDVALASCIYSDKEKLKILYEEYINIAINSDIPIMISTPTRRANKERVLKSEYNENIIFDNVRFLKEIRSKYSSKKIFVGGLMGCIGDAYKGNSIFNVEEAYKFHSWQANLFKKAKVDYLYAGIMPSISEALGMAKAMEETNIPYIISFMIRDNGKLLDGTPIIDAIKTIDKNTHNNPICYMSNCVHPNIVINALKKPFNNNSTIKSRFIGLQANAADFSVEELDNSEELKSSSPREIASKMKILYDNNNFKIFGGCCGTDQSHLKAIALMLKSN